MSERTDDTRFLVDQPSGDTPGWKHPLQVEAERLAAEKAAEEADKAPVELGPENAGYVAPPVDPSLPRASRPYTVPEITGEARSRAYGPQGVDEPPVQESQLPQAADNTRPIRNFRLDAVYSGPHVFFFTDRR